MELLVSVPAAVEDALASLMLDPSDPTLQHRGAITYIRRLYHPYLLGNPTFTLLSGVAKPLIRAGDAAETASSVDGIIAASTWLYEDPSAFAPIPLTSDDDSSGGGRGVGRRTCAGALLLLERLSALAPGLQRIQSELTVLGVGRLPLTLHVVLAASTASSASSSFGLGCGGVSLDASLVRLDDGLSLVSRADIGETSEMHPEIAAKAAEEVMSGSVILMVQ